MALSLRRPTDSPMTTDETNQPNQRTELFAKFAAAPNTPDRNSADTRSPPFEVLAENLILLASSSQAGLHSVHLQLTVFP
jgi:hypothetical protein